MRVLAALAMLWVTAPAAAATVEELAARQDWQLRAHETLLGSLDAALRCGERGDPPRWVHLRMQVAPDGAREDLDTGEAPRLLHRCLDEALPRSLPAPGEERSLVRTLFFDFGFASDGFPGPQQLRAPLLLDGAVASRLHGVALGPLPAEDAPPPERLERSVFVDTAREAAVDLRRRFWLQGLLDAVTERASVLRACGGDSLLLLEVAPDGAVTAGPEPCWSEALTEVRLPPSPNGAPGRIALALTEDGLVRADWPGQEDEVLSEADEAMVLAAMDRAGPATAVCWADELDRHLFRKRPRGELRVGVVVGSAGEAAQVLTDGELAGGRFAECVAEAHRQLGFAPPKDATPVLVLVRYGFAPEW